MATAINYKCPNCAAALAFEISTQKWDCHFCNSSFNKDELSRISSQKGESRIEEAGWQAEAFDKNNMIAFTCPSCGGRVIAEKNTAATFCVYCHNPTVLAAQLQGEYRPARIIPFKKTKTEAVAALQNHCKGPFMPKVFKEYARRGEMTGLYVPYWLFSAVARAGLTGRGEKVSSWSDSDYRYTKTDSYRIERQVSVPFNLVPADASERLDDKLMEDMEPFAYSQLTDFSMEYLSGHFAESYDVDAAKSSRRFEQRIDKTVTEILKGSVHGFTSYNYSLTNRDLARRTTLYVMLPVWIIMVKYNGIIHTFAMNGQSGKISGRLPFSWKRVFAWFGTLAGAFSLLFLLGGLFL
ncbi:hypothetical protein [Breznakiella homolactica]|uniref:Replication restart DNA helicase PriA n=1 Tax=Breznakiella homolactica TaxID=2798577 RepID=A0A7T7XK81_9SPIR|nr:hypothetical protein [Breznakiella homolactica]QQO07825.1 hypothetical protein JFL75_12845 [Breznakiella homolactica]